MPYGILSLAKFGSDRVSGWIFKSPTFGKRFWRR